MRPSRLYFDAQMRKAFHQVFRIATFPIPRVKTEKFPKITAMAIPTDKKSVQDIFETLVVIRKGSEEDPELRASDDEKVWGVKMSDEPSRPTYVLYAGTDAKELACDAADYDISDDE